MDTSLQVSYDVIQSHAAKLNRREMNFFLVVSHQEQGLLWREDPARKCREITGQTQMKRSGKMGSPKSSVIAKINYQMAILLKLPEEIEKARASNRIVAEVLNRLREKIKPGRQNKGT